MQQANSQAFGFQPLPPFRPGGSLSIAPLDPGSLGNMQSGGNFELGHAAASTMSAFAGATGQTHFGARIPPGPLALGAQGGTLGRGWASAGGVDPVNTPTAHSPRDLSSAFMAAAMQQPTLQPSPQQQQQAALLPQTPTNRHAAIQSSFLPLLTPPQMTPAASLVPHAPHSAAGAGATAAAASVTAALAHMQAGEVHSSTQAPSGPLGDPLQQLLSDPALLEAVLRGDWQGQGQGQGQAIANTPGAPAAAPGSSTRPLLDLSGPLPPQQGGGNSSMDVAGSMGSYPGAAAGGMGSMGAASLQLQGPILAPHSPSQFWADHPDDQQGAGGPSSSSPHAPTPTSALGAPAGFGFGPDAPGSNPAEHTTAGFPASALAAAGRAASITRMPRTGALTLPVGLPGHMLMDLDPSQYFGQQSPELHPTPATAVPPPSLLPPAAHSLLGGPGVADTLGPDGEQLGPDAAMGGTFHTLLPPTDISPLSSPFTDRTGAAPQQSVLPPTTAANGAGPDGTSDMGPAAYPSAYCSSPTAAAAAAAAAAEAEAAAMAAASAFAPYSHKQLLPAAAEDTEMPASQEHSGVFSPTAAQPTAQPAANIKQQRRRTKAAHTQNAAALLAVAGSTAAGAAGAGAVQDGSPPEGAEGWGQGAGGDGSQHSPSTRSKRRRKGSGSREQQQAAAEAAAAEAAAALEAGDAGAAVATGGEIGSPGATAASGKSSPGGSKGSPKKKQSPVRGAGSGRRGSAGKQGSPTAAAAEKSPSLGPAQDADAAAAAEGDADAAGAEQEEEEELPELTGQLKWLYHLTSTKAFFKPCRHCRGPGGREATFFDLEDPETGPMCAGCASASSREDHKVVQVRRSTYHEVLKLAEAQPLLQIKGVQPYVINGAKVLFLRSRPQPRAPKSTAVPGSTSRCVVDGRTLMEDGMAYCSIRCKYEHEHPEDFAKWVARVKAQETYVPRPGSRAAGSSAARAPAPASSKKAAAAPKGSSPGTSTGPAAASGASRQKNAAGSKGKSSPTDTATPAATAEGVPAGANAAGAAGNSVPGSSAAPSSAAAAAADGLSGGGVNISQVTREVADLYRGLGAAGQGAKQAPSAGRSRRPSQRVTQQRSRQRKRKRSSRRGGDDDGGLSSEQEDDGDLDYAAEGDASAGEDGFETLTDGAGSGRAGKGGKGRRPSVKGSAGSRGAAGSSYRSRSRQRQQSAAGADESLGFRDDEVMGSHLGPMPSHSGGLDTLAAAAAASEEAHQQEDVHRRLFAGDPIAAATVAAAAAAAEHHSQQGPHTSGHGYGHTFDPSTHSPHSYSGLGLVGFERGGASYSSGRQRSRSPAADAAAAIAAAAAAQATAAAAEEAEAAALDAAGVLVGDGSGLSQQGLGSTVVNPNANPTHSMEVDTPVWRDALQRQQQQHLHDRRSSETSAYQAGSAVAGTSPAAAAAATAAAFPASPTGHWEGFQGSRFNNLLSSPAGGLALGFWPKGSRDDVALGQLTPRMLGPTHQGFAARPPHPSAFSHPQQQQQQRGRGSASSGGVGAGAGGRGGRGPRGSADGGGGWGRRGSSDGGLAAAAFDALAAHQGRLGCIRGFEGLEGLSGPGAGVGAGTRSEGAYMPPGRASLLTTGAGVRTPEVVLPSWGVRVKRSGRHQVKMTDADVVMRPAQSAQQQDDSTAAGTGPGDGTQGDTIPGPGAAAAAGDAAVAFGSPADTAGVVEAEEGPAVSPAGEGLGVGVYSPHHHDPGDLSDSCSQRQVPSPSRGTPRSRWRSSTQQLAQLAPLSIPHDAATAAAAAAGLDAMLAAPAGGAGADHPGAPVPADALLDAAALLDLEPRYQGPSLSAPPAPDAQHTAPLAHRSMQHAQRGGFLQQRMSAASGSRLSPQITPQSTPLHSPMNRGASGEVQGPLALPPAALGATAAAGDSILAAAPGDSMLASALGDSMLAAGPAGAHGTADRDSMLAAAVAAAVAAGGGAAAARGPGRGHLPRPLTPPRPPGASAAAAAGHMAGYVSGEEEGVGAGWLDPHGGVLAAVAPSSSSGRRGRGRTRGRGRGGQHSSTSAGVGGTRAQALPEAGTEAVAPGAAGGGGVRTRSSGHAAAAGGGAAGSAQAAGAAAEAAAAGYGSDGDSDHSRRSTSSHRRKAAPHRARFGA